MTRANRYGGKRRAALMMTILAGALVVNGCRTNVASPAPAPSPPATPPGPADLPLERFWAFTAPWDARSDSSLRAHRSELDAAVTGWIQLDSVTGRPDLLYPDNTPRNRASMSRFALVTTWHGQGFHPNVVRRIAARPDELGAVASRLGRFVARHHYQGLVFDLEGQSPADTGRTARVVRALADSARSHGATTIVVALPAADSAAYPTRAFFPVADYALIMLYDEHWSTSAPGPVATPDWVRRALAQRIADIGVEHIVAALPLYGYLWRGSRPAEPLGFVDARRAAAQANVEIVRDPVSRSLHAIQPGSWELWSSDAELLSALRHEVATLGVTRLALWRLGQEDPGVWPLIARWSVPR